MNDQLMLGILLIIVGLAVGLIAVALVLNRRELQKDSLETERDEQEADRESEEAIQPDLGEDEEPLEVADEGQEVEDVEEKSAEDSGDLAVSAPRERHLVAEVYREEVTGRLIVRAGDREYTDGRQIEDEGERRRLAYAVSDLSDWFLGEFEASGRPAAASTQPTASNDQMLEEINAILQRSLAGTPDRGVRLFPNAAGGVKVLVGVKSYEIEDVPDKEIKDLIRQAVAEWEAGQ